MLRALCGRAALDLHGDALLQLRGASFEGSDQPRFTCCERLMSSHESAFSIFVNTGDVSFGIRADARDRRSKGSQFGASDVGKLGARRSSASVAVRKSQRNGLVDSDSGFGGAMLCGTELLTKQQHLSLVRRCGGADLVA